jgi:hypothetical protein
VALGISNLHADRVGGQHREERDYPSRSHGILVEETPLSRERKHVIKRAYFEYRTGDCSGEKVRRTFSD